VANDIPRGFEFHKCFYSPVAPIYHTLLLSNTIITDGDMLMGAAGYAALTNITSTDGLLGVSLSKQATSITTNPKISFVPALQGVLFRGNCSGTPSQALVWTYVDIEGTTGIMEVNEDASDVDALMITELSPAEDSFAANSDVVVQIHNSLWAQAVPS
jgi:hypothetical protein